MHTRTSRSHGAAGPVLQGGAVRATLHVEPAAVRANVRTIRSRTSARVMAVVKADGFGLGMVPVARAAVEGGATWLGVTDLGDAAVLRGSGLSVPILAWLHQGGLDVGLAVRTGTDLAVGSTDELRQVVERGAGRAGSREPVRVHLHLDTGMARGGVPRAQWPALFRAARQAQDDGAVRVVGLMGHLPDADLGDPEQNVDGVRAYDAGRRMAAAWGMASVLTHLGATAAALTDPATHYGMVRIGAGLAGIDPSGTTALHGAATLTAPVVHTAEVPAGTAVGYGGTYVTPVATHLSVLGVGYGDGIPRELSHEATVQLGDHRHRVVGRVSMDQVVVDTGPVAYPRGALATVFGPAGTPAPTVNDWARWAGTIPHAILTGIGPRVRRAVG